MILDTDFETVAEYEIRLNEDNDRSHDLRPSSRSIVYRMQDDTLFVTFTNNESDSEGVRVFIIKGAVTVGATTETNFFS